MQTSLVNVALFSFVQLLLSLTCFHEGVGAASGKGEFIIRFSTESGGITSRLCFV